MIRLRRLVIIGILAFVLVSACRGNPPQQTNSQANDTSTEAVRVVDHALGKTKVPLDPQRIVVLSTGLDTVLSLEVKPVGSIKGNHRHYLKNRLEGVESVGNPGRPNLEAIVALKPDLILGSDLEDNPNYNLLSQIAPTVIAKVRDSGDWKEMSSLYGEALGKPDKAEQIVADYYARIENFQAQMGDRLQETKVSLVNVRQNQILLYLEESFPGTIVADAGLPRSPYQTNTEQTFSMDISKELLHKADGDIIFVWIAARNEAIAKDDRTALKQLKADSLWSKLNTVQQGKVYEVPSYWIGTGPIAANLILDDLFEYLVEDNL